MVTAAHAVVTFRESRQRLVSIVCLLHALQCILFQDGRKHLVGAAGSLLGLNGGLLTHGGENDDVWKAVSIHGAGRGNGNTHWCPSPRP